METKETGLKVVECLKPRFLFRPLRREGLSRHRVTRWINCSQTLRSIPEATFIRDLKVIFLVTLILGVIHIYMTSVRGLFWLPPYMETRFVLPVIFAVVTVATVCVKMMTNIYSVPPRTEEVKTISALIQHVKIDITPPNTQECCSAMKTEQKSLI